MPRPSWDYSSPDKGLGFEEARDVRTPSLAKMMASVEGLLTEGVELDTKLKAFHVCVLARRFFHAAKDCDVIDFDVPLGRRPRVVW